MSKSGFKIEKLNIRLHLDENAYTAKFVSALVNQFVDRNDYQIETGINVRKDVCVLVMKLGHVQYLFERCYEVQT